MRTSYLKKLLNRLGLNGFDLILILLILGIAIFVAFRNFTPGTWLLGWDSLVPELNFKLNAARSLSAAWQEYQGLGLLGGMGHAADLPRQLFLWLISFSVPTSFLRYFWTFLMLSIGPVGVYLTVSKVVLGKASNFASGMAGFVSACFYLLNLGTVQTFFTPFETFTGFYGFFPWLLYFGLDFLKHGGRKRLLGYFVLSLISTVAFYVQTMFVVYAVIITIFALGTIFATGKTGIVRSLKLGLATLFANAFWLFPVLLFSITSSNIPANSHINSIATPETQYMNEARGNFTDIASLKGYWFDYYDWDNSGNYTYLYKDWIGYTGNDLVKNIPVYLFYISAFGFLVSLFKKDISFKFTFPLLLIISYIFLAGNNQPTGVAFKFLSNKIPFFAEIFRNAFTKWSISTSFFYAVGLGLVVYSLAGIFKNKLSVLVSLVVAIPILIAIFYSVIPVFYGGLISNSMRINLPADYLDTINYFKSQNPNQRIADFPLTDFWGWKFTDWGAPAGGQGYRGSGFLWYGIAQPMLDRAFDVWSPFNEQFYNEVSPAIFYGTKKDVEYIFKKYQINYILFDGSVIQPGDMYASSNLQKEKDFLDNNPLITKEKVFGKITIYKFNLEGIDSFISSPKVDFSSPLTAIGPVGNLFIKEDFNSAQGYKNARNCDLNSKGSVTKTKIDGGNYYAAYDGASSCDYFYYPTLDYSKAYLLKIKGKNISGRSLKFYLYNVKGQRVDKEELLPTGDFDSSFIIPPTATIAAVQVKVKNKATEGGYTLSVETRSFGNVKSENQITSIEFYTLGYSKSVPKPLVNDLVVTNIQKYGTWGYKVDVQDYGLIQLSQGYDNGWVGMQYQNSNIKFQNYISNFKILEHVKVNSWANGWVVPVDPSSPITVHRSPFTEHQIVYIIFWPQLLEWGGAILGIFSLIFLFSKRRN